MNPSSPTAASHPARPTPSAVRGRALITGLRGFTGSYLAQELEADGYEVFGTAHGNEELANNIFAVDLCDRQRLNEVIADVRADVVFHLAAIANVAHDDIEVIYHTNLIGTHNLLQALAANDHAPRAVLLASSANIYGNATVEPIDEQVVARPENDYAVSKSAMEKMARLWQNILPLTIVRPFNYTGVGQSESFLLPKIVAHFRRQASVIELGNLDVARDFSDVRTVVGAYRRLVQTAAPGQTFNVCSGCGYSLQEVIDMLQRIAGYEIEVRINPAFVRANEVKRLVGSNAKLLDAIGELTPISLHETLTWMYQEEPMVNF
ncbi:MAG: NAD-dependent epimerase/dehydratase family protein [Glaciimonas sp.]|nr:NAD-dependent epimerase/dehydratase family protein [Glaciimonas sp.]